MPGTSTRYETDVVAVPVLHVAQSMMVWSARGKPANSGVPVPHQVASKFAVEVETRNATVDPGEAVPLPLPAGFQAVASGKVVVASECVSVAVDEARLAVIW